MHIKLCVFISWIKLQTNVVCVLAEDVSFEDKQFSSYLLHLIIYIVIEILTYSNFVWHECKCSKYSKSCRRWLMIDWLMIDGVGVTSVNCIFHILSLCCCRVLFSVFNFFLTRIYPKLPYSVVHRDRIAVMPEIFIPPSRHSFVSPISMVLFQPRKIQKLPYTRTRSASNVFIESGICRVHASKSFDF